MKNLFVILNFLFFNALGQYDSTKIVSLENLVVSKTLDAQNLFSKVDLKLKPVGSSQDLLRLVPGLFIGQHAGGGKAEQIFLRGFDIDHGTDLNITVDNMPVNMVSHAHGQGYADLHFVIPETLAEIDYAKGSYKAEQGNFATAGSVGFKTKNKFEESSISVESGSFNQKRAVGLFNLNLGQNSDSYLATEYLYNDGPFESPQKLNRLNLMGKFSKKITQNTNIIISASQFSSKWNASGQIPQRAIESGLIGRFGAIDNTEGGNTARQNIGFSLFNSLKNSNIASNFYYSHYDFTLFSNFTFFAQNAEKGDQIKHTESRNILGYSSKFNSNAHSLRLPFTYSTEVGFRNDIISDNELSRTFMKINTLEVIKLGDINELNAFLNAEANFSKDKWSIITGLRADLFRFSYENKLSNSTSNFSQILFSPKINFIYQPNNQFQYFLKFGSGYHSNDTRSAVENNQAIPKSIGSDLGLIFKPINKIIIQATLWQLYLQQEFVYVGDAGIIEPSGRTNRMGVDLTSRIQLNNFLFFDADYTYTYARSLDSEKGNNFIPLAPVNTLTAGFSMATIKNFSGGLHTRLLGKRAANEDYSLTAQGYSITDFNINYSFKKAVFKVEIQNLFNAQWNETQFATASRLRNEKEIIEEIHFTPGSPFGIRAGVSVKF